MDKKKVTKEDDIVAVGFACYANLWIDFLKLAKEKGMTPTDLFRKLMAPHLQSDALPRKDHSRG